MKVRALTLVLLLALVTMVGSVFAQDDDMSGNTIADIVVSQAEAEEPQFTTLLAAVEAADPAILEALSNADASLTVFAPTDESFAQLPGFVIDYLTTQNTELLTTTLQYHVVEGAAMSGDLESGEVDTLAGEAVNVDVAEDGVFVNDATVVTADIEASNGVIHVIDTVLVPSVPLETVEPGFVEGDIVSAGSSTVGPLSQAVQEKFVEEGYTGEVSNAIIGSGAGFERFCVEGETDISNASRPIRDSEVESCQSLEPPRNPIPFRVGTDAVSVVVNPNNDFVENVTLEELSQIMGPATTWADVRSEWPDEPITRFIPGTDSGTFDFFTEVVYGEDNEGPQLDAGNLNQSEDDNVLLEGVANNEYAVGYFGYAYYVNNQESLKLLNIDGVEPTARTLDTYALARPLFIYSDANIIQEKPQVGQFISYYLQNVNEVIGEVGYFPTPEAPMNRNKLVIKSLIDTGE